jgi:hypothetical protein
MRCARERDTGDDCVRAKERERGRERETMREREREREKDGQAPSLKRRGAGRPPRPGAPRLEISFTASGVRASQR